MDSIDVRPILLVASGHRCGSTLAQRLLSSHPEVFLWGEHDGILRDIVGARDRLLTCDEKHGRLVREEYMKHGPQSFMANITPERAVVDQAFRTLLCELFAIPAASLGRRRWGFKEVRYGAWECGRVVELFPDARIIHMTRDPWKVLASLIRMEAKDAAWTREFSRRALALWRSINASFIDAPPKGLQVLRLKFEDLNADPETVLTRLAAWIDVDPAGIDRTVLEQRIWNFGKSGAAKNVSRDELLRHPLAEALLDPEFDRVARAYGYATLDHSDAAASNAR